MITLSCPSCEKKLKVKDELAGKKIRCPQCKQTTDVPDGTVAFEPAKPSMAEDATVPPKPVSLNEDATVPPKPFMATDAIPEPRVERNGEPDEEESRESLKAEANYKVEGEIARGGMGAIMRAVDQDIRREVAVKFLLNHADDKMKARFVEEAQITGQFEHPNIVLRKPASCGTWPIVAALEDQYHAKQVNRPHFTPGTPRTNGKPA